MAGFKNFSISFNNGGSAGGVSPGGAASAGQESGLTTPQTSKFAQLLNTKSSNAVAVSTTPPASTSGSASGSDASTGGATSKGSSSAQDQLAQTYMSQTAMFFQNLQQQPAQIDVDQETDDEPPPPPPSDS